MVEVIDFLFLRLQMRLNEMLKQNKDLKSTSSLTERKVDDLTEENGVLSSRVMKLSNFMKCNLAVNLWLITCEGNNGMLCMLYWVFEFDGIGLKGSFEDLKVDI